MTFDVPFLGYEVSGKHRSPNTPVPHFGVNSSGEIFVCIMKARNVKTAVTLPEVAPTLSASKGCR